MSSKYFSLWSYSITASRVAVGFGDRWVGLAGSSSIANIHHLQDLLRRQKHRGMNGHLSKRAYLEVVLIDSSRAPKNFKKRSLLICVGFSRVTGLVIPINYPIVHHKHDLLHRMNIFQRITCYGDDVGPFSHGQ